MPTPRRRRNPQHPQVSTPAFKRWFGKSKIVDADGNPQRLYHMTTGNFDVFKPGGDDPRISGRAIWLTPYPENIPAAHSVMDYVKGEGLVYRAGANIMPLWARIENPLYILDADDAQYAEQFRLDSFGFPTTLSDKTIAAIRKAGYDGIVFGQWRSHEGYDLTTGRGVEVIVFDPHQLKSATGNRGTFDPADPSIVRNPRRRGLDVRPGIPGTYRTEFTTKGGRKRAYPARGGAAWDRTLVRVANETTVASGRVYDTVKRAERAGRATVRGKRGAVEVLRVTNPAPDAEPLVFYHGAQRWEGPPSIVAHRKGHAEHGAGIYLTTAWTTASNYAKGGGSVYRFEVVPDVVWLEDARLPVAETVRWVKSLPRLKGKTDIVATLERVAGRVGPNIPAETLVAAFVNFDASAGQHGPSLADYLVAHGIDASHVSRSSEDWVVVFNPAKVLRVTRVSARETGEGFAYDLPRVKRKNPRRRKNGALAPLVVGGVALAAGAVVYHGLRGSGGGSVAGWKRERLPASLGKGYRYTRRIGNAEYAIEENTTDERISLRVQDSGLQSESLHPNDSDWGSWPSVEEAAQFAEQDAAWRERNPIPSRVEDTATWKRVKTKEGKRRGDGEFQHIRVINGMKYVITVDRYEGNSDIIMEGGPRGLRIHPPDTDYGRWGTLEEAKAAAEEDARQYAGWKRNGLFGALVVGGLGFAAGAYVEHERPFVARAKERLRGPTKTAREQAARLQREVFTPAPAKRASAPAPAPAKRTATTDPAWRRERNHQGKGYSHLRTINGVDYEVWERIYSDGGKAIFLEAGDKRDRIYAPNGEEDGWVSVAAAKKAAEADAKTRKNPRRRK